MKKKSFRIKTEKTENSISNPDNEKWYVDPKSTSKPVKQEKPVKKEQGLYNHGNRESSNRSRAHLGDPSQFRDAEEGHLTNLGSSRHT